MHRHGVYLWPYHIKNAITRLIAAYVVGNSRSACALLGALLICCAIWNSPKCFR